MILAEYKEQPREFGSVTRSSFSMTAPFISFIYFSKLLMKIDGSMITIIQERKYSTEITFVLLNSSKGNVYGMQKSVCFSFQFCQFHF